MTGTQVRETTTTANSGECDSKTRPVRRYLTQGTFHAPGECDSKMRPVRRDRYRDQCESVINKTAKCGRGKNQKREIETALVPLMASGRATKGNRCKK